MARTKNQRRTPSSSSQPAPNRRPAASQPVSREGELKLTGALRFVLGLVRLLTFKILDVPGPLEWNYYIRLSGAVNTTTFGLLELGLSFWSTPITRLKKGIYYSVSIFGILTDTVAVIYYPDMSTVFNPTPKIRKSEYNYSEYIRATVLVSFACCVINFALLARSIHVFNCLLREQKSKKSKMQMTTSTSTAEARNEEGHSNAPPAS